MMPTPDFGDLHKFRTSLAIAMMVVGPTIVYWLTREPLQPVPDPDSLPSHTNSIQTVFILTLEWVRFVLRPLGVLAGLALLGVGFFSFRKVIPQWQRIQDAQDEIIFLDKSMKEAGMRPATAAEKMEKDILAEKITGESLNTGSSDTLDDVMPAMAHLDFNKVLSKREIEARVGAWLQRFGMSTFSILPDMKVRGIIVDYLLRSHHSTIADYFVEIKVIDNLPSLDAMFLQGIYLGDIARSYGTTFSRPIRVLMMAVLRDEVPIPAKQLEEFVSSRRHSDLSPGFTIVAVNESRIESLDIDDFEKVFYQLARNTDSIAVEL